MNKLKTYNKASLRIFAVLVCVSLSVTFFGTFSYAQGDGASELLSDTRGIYDREYYEQELLRAGFPADYARELAKIKLAHPTWRFEPLLISELDPGYSFGYIIKKETENPATNLVYPSKEYSSYFDRGYGAVYDSGWYSASDDAVRYFIDPRNFLNERDIFQFEDVGYHERDYSSGVSGILDGTFMDGMKLENGMSVEEYLLFVGKKLGVSPVHIAARLRQEQGTRGESGMISGQCGDLLAYFYKNKVQKTNDGILVNTPSYGYSQNGLKAYNNLYNFFNVGASGNGVFYIYLNAMKKAQTGTPDLASEWGGSGKWDKMYKSIYGGVFSLKKTYVDDYQNTLYLQKFNVDPRSSRNFWGQYMQNVGAALSEGRAAYDSYREAGILESEFTFLIPVYSSMPNDPCPDPSGGNSPYAQSKKNDGYLTHMDYPYSQSKNNAETVLSHTVSLSDTVRIQGYSVHDRGTLFYEMSVDGGEFTSVNSYPRLDVREKYAESYPLSYDVNAYLVYLDAAALGVGAHRVILRAKATDGTYYQVSRIEIVVLDNKDLDGDGEVGFDDVMLLVGYLNGSDKIFAGDPDINGDGVVDIRDAIALLLYIDEKNVQ